MTIKAPDSISATLPSLVLPKRFEILEREAKKAGVDPADVVERVDAAAVRIEQLLRQVRDGGTGLFEVYFGPSGIGKTTFLQTLPRFFEKIRVEIIPSTLPLLEIEQELQRTYQPGTAPLRLFVLKDRDNAKISESEAEDFFEMLRRVFRTDYGQALIVWPVTRPETRDVLGSVAWKIAADSVVPIDTRGVYEFAGLPKERFYSVAALTVASLNGDSLDAYGVSAETAQGLLEKSATLGQFYTLLESEAASRRERTWNVLKQKVRPRVWIVVSGDDGQYVSSTVARLSQGRRARVDLELILDFLDDAANDAVYLEKWRQRRNDVGYLMRTLDVRLVPLPPSPALAAIRAFGADPLRTKLKKKNETIDAALDAISKSRLAKGIFEQFGVPAAPFVEGRPASTDTEDEFIRIQQTASSDDKPLNRALGAAIESLLQREGLTIKVLSEKRNLPGTNLQPDVQIWIDDAEVICLEPTWRTTGRGIENEVSKGQNSMTPGNIQKYLLAKVYDYVVGLGL